MTAIWPPDRSSQPTVNKGNSLRWPDPWLFRHGRSVRSRPAGSAAGSRRFQGHARTRCVEAERGNFAFLLELDPANVPGRLALSVIVLFSGQSFRFRTPHSFAPSRYRAASSERPAVSISVMSSRHRRFRAKRWPHRIGPACAAVTLAGPRWFQRRRCGRSLEYPSPRP